MRKFYLTSLLISCFFIATAQQLINQKDPFTGKSMKGAAVVLGRALAPTGMQLIFMIKDDKKYIAFVWIAPSGTNGAFNNAKVEDLSLLLKMDNDTILKFKADTSVSKIANIGNNSNLSFGCVITDEQLKFMTEHEISLLRIGIKDDNGVDLKDALFTDKNRKQVQKAAAYMSEK